MYRNLLSSLGAVLIATMLPLLAQAVSENDVVERLGLDPIVSETPVIGVVGDSLSDEYAFYPYGTYQRNWVQLLETTEMGQLGDFQSFRMYPRLYGYEYNWARAGAESKHVISEGQLSGLRQQIEDGKIEAAVLLIGANDFSAAFNEIYSGDWNEDEIDSFLNGLKENLQTIVEGLVASEPPILIICTIPDLGDTPSMYNDYTDEEGRAAVREVIIEANDYITQLTETHHIALLDVYAWFKQIVKEPQHRYLGYRVDTTRGGNEPRKLFCNDEFHPGTLAQNYLANMILTTIENERVRLINEQIEAYNERKTTADPAFVAEALIEADYHLIKNHQIFPLVGVDPLPEISFPYANFIGAGEDLMESFWFGIYSVDRFPWINHLYHGWMYCDGYGGEEFRMWDSHLGWFHSRIEIYPLIIRESDGHVLRYERESHDPRRFWDYHTEEWIEIPYGAFTEAP